MLVVETDEKFHNERPENYEKERQKDLEKVGYYFIRTNPDKPGFDDYEEFGRASSYIAKSIKNQTKNKLKNDLKKQTKKSEKESNKKIKEIEDEIKKIKLKLTSQITQ